MVPLKLKHKVKPVNSVKPSISNKINKAESKLTLDSKNIFNKIYLLGVRPIRYSIKKYKEFSCSVSNERFYCTALQGRAHHSLAINSDLTVSCMFIFQ